MHAMDTGLPGQFSGLGDKILPILAAVAFLLTPLGGLPLLAQGLESEEAIDAIVGSDVKTQEADEGDKTDRVIVAVENSLDSAESVRKAFSLDTLEIIFLPEKTANSGPVAEAVEENEEAIETLRQSIEGSAMFYHAIDSRSILLRNIIAVEFAEDNSVTVFVRGNGRQTE